MVTLRRCNCHLRLSSHVARRLVYFILGCFVACVSINLWISKRQLPDLLKIFPGKRFNQWEGINKVKCPDLVRPDVSSSIIGWFKSHSMATEKLYGAWHVVNDTQIEVYVFSVFFDARMGVLRILAVGRTISDSQQVVCQLWYDDFTYPLVTQAKVTKNGRGHTIGGVHYEQYYFTCDAITLNSMPTHVSLVTSECGQSNNFIPITVPSRTKVHDFGICVPVSYWHIDPNRIIEWVEANRLFGVGEFNVYHVHMDAATMKVLKYYESKGIMRLTHLPTVPKYQHDFDGVSIGSPISLNDCMYRNMYRYKWIMVVDFDNLIIPHLSNTYSQMLKQVEEQRINEPIAVSYTVRNMYHWIGCGFESDGFYWEGSYFYKYRHRLQANNFLFSAESFVDPLYCESIFNHYCYISLQLPNRIPWTVDLPPSVAATHHYRKVSPAENKTICPQVGQDGVQDNSMLRFEDDLRDRCQKVAQIIL